MDSIRLCLIRFLETNKRHFFTKWIWVGCLTIDLHRVARVSWWLIKERRAKVLEIGTGYISRRKDSTINVKNWKELARETNVWRITPLPPQARTRRPIWAQKEPVCVCVTKIDTTRENVGLCERVFANRQALLKQTKPKSNMCETATITPHGYGITHFQRQPGKGGGRHEFSRKSYDHGIRIDRFSDFHSPLTLATASHIYHLSHFPYIASLT